MKRAVKVAAVGLLGLLLLAMPLVALGASGSAGVSGTASQRLAIEVTGAAIAFGVMSNSGLLTGNVGADEGSATWRIHSSDRDLSPTGSITWTEKNTNVHAYYTVSVSHSAVSVTSQGTVHSFTPGDWLFFKTTTSSGDAYLLPSVSVTLGAAGATITEPVGVTAAEEGTLTITYISYDGSNASVASASLYLAWSGGRLYLDDDPNMREATDTNNGLTQISTPASNAAYAQGAYLSNDGDELTFNGVKLVVASDPAAFTGSGDGVTFNVGFFAPYDKTSGSVNMGEYVLIAEHDLFPGAKSFNYTVTITGTQHSTPS